MTLLIHAVLFLFQGVDNVMGLNASSPSTCNYITTYDTLNNILTNNLHDMGDIKCVQTDICTKTFNFTLIDTLPYHFKYLSVIKRTHVIHMLLETCCGSCFNYPAIKNLPNISALTEEHVQTSDFVYPIFASAQTRRLYGSYYLPFIPVPYGFYNKSQKKGTPKKARQKKGAPKNKKGTPKNKKGMPRTRHAKKEARQKRHVKKKARQKIKKACQEKGTPKKARQKKARQKNPKILPQQPLRSRADPGKYQPHLEPISCHHLTWISK